MKIIKSGNLNRRVICQRCSCEYEYEAHDIREDTNYSSAYISYPPQYSSSSYVACPECGYKHYIFNNAYSGTPNITITNPAQKIIR